MMERPPIFIGGLMKSGTTLMRVLIGNHPRIFAGLETHWFAPAFQASWRDAEASAIAKLLELFALDRPAHAALVAQSGDWQDFFEAFMAHCATRAGKPRWAEKTPGNAAHVDEIRARWPSARLIHMIRDPRDVYASWKKNAKYDLDRFLADARAIEASAGHRLGASDQGYLEIRYRDLVCRPEAAMKRAIAFVGEAWVPGIEQNHSDRSEHDRVLAVTGKASATLESIAKPIFQTSLGQWRTILAAAEARRIESELGEYGERTRCFDEREQ